MYLPLLRPSIDLRSATSTNHEPQPAETSTSSPQISHTPAQPQIEQTQSDLEPNVSVNEESVSDLPVGLHSVSATQPAIHVTEAPSEPPVLPATNGYWLPGFWSSLIGMSGTVPRGKAKTPKASLDLLVGEGKPVLEEMVIPSVAEPRGGGSPARRQMSPYRLNSVGRQSPDRPSPNWFFGLPGLSVLSSPRINLFSMRPSIIRSDTSGTGTLPQTPLKQPTPPDTTMQADMPQMGALSDELPRPPEAEMDEAVAAPPGEPEAVVSKAETPAGPACSPTVLMIRNDPISRLSRRIASSSTVTGSPMLVLELHYLALGGLILSSYCNFADRPQSVVSPSCHLSSTGLPDTGITTAESGDMHVGHYGPDLISSFYMVSLANSVDPIWSATTATGAGAVNAMSGGGESVGTASISRMKMSSGVGLFRRLDWPLSMVQTKTRLGHPGPLIFLAPGPQRPVTLWLAVDAFVHHRLTDLARRKLQPPQQAPLLFVFECASKNMVGKATTACDLDTSVGNCSEQLDMTMSKVTLLSAQ
ncbi:unnamed protein product [Protopolystoma xenopodis]|uniref:Uncharacterized protein n=1 Tax=Protopolystoma xenopodis TaxID=117903 RepID=A0A3S5CBI3_9PLAT|nr:unnamed protein product [Protopolystoma xenopodis]